MTDMRIKAITQDSSLETVMQRTDVGRESHPGRNALTGFSIRLQTRVKTLRADPTATRTGADVTFVSLLEKKLWPLWDSKSFCQGV